ncbi:5402_t:CDS:2, partial [Dentiscutata heterogama]
MATPIKTPEKRMSRVSCVDESCRLIDEIKHIIINLKRSKKIFDPIIHSSSETVRALHYVKHEVELYFQQYEDAFNKYKISLENIREFAKEVVNIEKSHYIFYPYKHVKDKYEKLVKEHENCEKRLHPILIKAIMDKQERQQEDIMNIHKILKNIPDENKNEKMVQIEKIIQNIIKRSDLDINVPHIDSALLFDPPRAGEDLEKSEWNLDNWLRTKLIVKKIYKRGIEVACEPITDYRQNLSILSELKKFDECQYILKFYGLSNIDGDEMLVFEWIGLGSLKNIYEKKKIRWDLKVKIARDICRGLIFLNHIDIFHRDVRCENIMIANFYLAKHASEIEPDDEDNISNHTLNIINWSAPEMMQKNALYTQECEVFSFIMLLWELAFQRIPYEKMSKEKIIAHVTQGRRETPNQPFFTLDVLNIQRKYLRIITDGWDNKPEKRITMDEILWRFLNIEAELAKLKNDNLSSAKRLRSISYPEKSIYNYKRFPNRLKSKERLALNLEGVDEEDIPYFIKSPMEIDFNSKRWKLEKPNKIESSNVVPTRLSSVVEAPNDASYSSEKYKEVISKQKEDGSIELDDSVCNELNAPKEDIITTILNNITSKKLQLPEFSSSIETAINLSYLKSFVSQHEDEWRDNYNKALEYLSKQIGDAGAERELLECADKYVANKAMDKVIEENKWDPEKDGQLLKNL